MTSAGPHQVRTYVRMYLYLSINISWHI